MENNIIGNHLLKCLTKYIKVVICHKHNPRKFVCISMGYFLYIWDLLRHCDTYWVLVWCWWIIKWMIHLDVLSSVMHLINYMKKENKFYGWLNIQYYLGEILKDCFFSKWLKSLLIALVLILVILTTVCIFSKLICTLFLVVARLLRIVSLWLLRDLNYSTRCILQFIS